MCSFILCTKKEQFEKVLDIFTKQGRVPKQEGFIINDNIWYLYGYNTVIEDSQRFTVHHLRHLDKECDEHFNIIPFDTWIGLPCKTEYTKEISLDRMWVDDMEIEGHDVDSLTYRDLAQDIIFSLPIEIFDKVFTKVKEVRSDTIYYKLKLNV